MGSLDRHLTELEAKQLVERQLSMMAAFRAGLHLYYCGRCRDMLNRIDPEGFEAFRQAFGLGREGFPATGGDPSVIAEWMDKAMRAQRHVETLQSKLEALSPERRRLLLRNVESIPLYCKCIAITKTCKDLFLSSPKGALDLAACGLELLSQHRADLDPEEATSLEASLLAHYGNGLRLVGELRKAERTLRKAERLARGVGDPLERAWACYYYGYTLADSRRYREALRKAKTARRIFESVRDEQLSRETEFLAASIHADAGDFEESNRVLQVLMEDLDEFAHPRLALSVYYQLSLNLIQLGSPFEARGLLPKVKGLAEGEGGISAVRADLLEALTLEGLLDLAGAERCLSEVRQSLGTEYPFDFALVTLDLMRVRLRRGAAPSAVGLVRDLLPLLKAKRVHSEALRALRLLTKKRVESQAIRAVQDFLEKLQRDPSYTVEDANLSVS